MNCINLKKWRPLLATAGLMGLQVFSSTALAARPAAPTSLVAKPLTSTSVQLNWQDNANDELGFVVERAPKGSTAFQEVGKLSANATEFKDLKAAPSTTYKYRVGAFNQGRGKLLYSFSTSALVSTPATTTPTPTPAPSPTPVPTPVPTATPQPSPSPSPTPPAPVSDWTKCANEGESCSFTGTRNVRYGYNGQYVTKIAIVAPVACTNESFGRDPYPNYMKSCEYSASQVSAPSPTPSPSATPIPVPTPLPTPSPSPTPVQSPAPAPTQGENSVMIIDRSGMAQSQYPVQIARPFAQGEVANFPQALINGTPVLTQADVKQRYADGSVKHSLISFIVPQLPASGSVKVTFRNQTTGNNTPLSATEMLSADYSFEAEMQMRSGGTLLTASARRMLQDGKFTYWASGPIATTIILADHSANRTYDVGFDNYKSIRPIFHATFFPASKKVRVRFIGENANTTTLQDVKYDLDLYTGNTNPIRQYNKAGLQHYLMTRWTKTFWIGSEPEKRVNVDHNLSYVAETRFFPNFDTSKALSETTLAQSYTNWMQAKKDLYDRGNWTTYMPTTGGRAEIGLYPTWTMNWLHSGDWRAREEALTAADLAGAWPLHLREGNTTMRFDRAQTIPAVGKPVSLNARPNDYVPDNNGNNSLLLPVSRIPTPEYPYVAGSWVADDAHQPDPFSAQYVLTGDFFYLEEMQLWVAASALAQSPYYSRGLPGRAAIHSQIRGNAWLLRNRMHAAFLTPDSMTAEKTFFNEYFNDAVTMWEGERNFTGTQFQNDPLWIKGNTDPHFRYKTVSNLGFWFAATPNGFEGYWQDYFLLSALGLAKEQGFPVDRLFAYHSKVLTGQFNDPGYDPRLVNYYYTTVCDSAGNYYQSFAAVQNAMPDRGATTIAEFTPHYGSSLYVVGAGAFTSTESGGATAWSWLQSNIHSKTDMMTGEAIKFNIVPRK